MPYIESEVPSETELRAYFEESAPLRYIIPPIDQLPAGWHDSLLPVYSNGGEEFRIAANEELWKGLCRMNALPREDGFWNNTNRRPTTYKLAEFCQKCIAEKPDDTNALWCLGILEMSAGDRFGQDYWLKLSKSTSFDMRWAICAACLTDGATPDSPYQFAEFLSEIKDTHDVRALLDPFATCGVPEVQQRATAALAQLASRR